MSACMKRDHDPIRAGDVLLYRDARKHAVIIVFLGAASAGSQGMLEAVKIWGSNVYRIRYSANEVQKNVWTSLGWTLLEGEGDP